MNDDAVARSLARGDVEGAGLDPADECMLRYALALTRDPISITRDRVDDLRAHGFDDVAVHDICHVTAYFNYVNRLADGLGVELEDWWAEKDLILTREEFGKSRGQESS